MFRDSKKKCIAKKCEDCQFYTSWDMVNNEGLRKTNKKCGFEVLFDEIPRIRGAVDGCQTATNETYNKVDSFGNASIETLRMIDEKIPKLLR